MVEDLSRPDVSRRILLTRIHDIIQVEGERIDNACQDIGKKYVQLHPEDFEDVYSEEMGSIRKATEQIALLKLQKQLVIGVPNCPECGKNLPKGSNFCNHCGTKLPVLPYERYDKCKCGAYIEKDWDICMICGASKNEYDSRWIQCPSCQNFVDKANRFCPNCAHPLTHSEEKPRKCPHCGSDVAEGLRFCTECGHRTDCIVD